MTILFYPLNLRYISKYKFSFAVNYTFSVEPIYYGASIMIYLKWSCSELSCSLCCIKQKYIKEKLYADHKKSIEQSIKYSITLCCHFKTVFLFYFVCLFFAVGYYKTWWSAIE